MNDKDWKDMRDAISETPMVEIPDESENNIGDGADITKEVDPFGEPLGDDEQDKARIEYWNAQIPALSTTSIPTLSITEYSYMWKEDSGDQPYCPVYAFKTDKGRVFFAYITGPINDVDDYIDLIDTLLIAKEKDTYYVFIDSPGGLVASGGIIASAIYHSKAEVFTVARGICASSAAMVHSSAKSGHCIVTPFAVMMYHMSAHYDNGVSTKIAERALNQIQYVNKCVLNRALAKGHINQDEFDQIQSGKDVYVPAAEFIARTKNKAAQS